MDTEKPDTTTEPKGESRVKRDFLRKIEIEAQKQWEEQKIFELDAPEDTSQPKYFVSFPYPYMNGRLHLGHTFTITKAEFAVNFQRMKGKRAIFPFGMHCTGMPIMACADKLKREIEQFGNPPNFPSQEDGVGNGSTEKEPQTKEDPLAFHAKKSKLKSKGGNAKYQWEIMQEMGVPDSEIPKFADAKYWLSYFPPYCVQDLKHMGAAVDWRRSFITTEVNPYYDSFVKWQFEHFKEKGKILFGKRYTIYSPKDGQPCTDHDRQSGEGVLPQEYTLIKLEVYEPFPEKLKALAGKKVFLVAGTLRPETMYGQTNCWILPDGEYGAFEINATDVFICTARAARNMAYQGLSKQPQQVSCLLKLTGWDLLGIAVKAPLSKYPVVYVLPMLTILPTKGTGIVTSVPSDSPDDFINLEELKRKPAFREKFHIKDEMLMKHEVVPIIEVPEFGTTAAAVACDKLKIKSPNDKLLLEQAKELVYQKGFYEGKMIVGQHKGKPVKEAKPIIRELLLSTGQAVMYSEPASLVMSRSGDECVVCLTDQWFMNYGEPTWRAQVENHLKNMELYSMETRHKFEMAFDWIVQWACSRTYGLGTRLPWDNQYLIDSLSDSTIYMAFYTIAHLLQGGVIDGSSVGPAKIKPEQLTRKVWDYIYLEAAYPSDCGIPEETLKKLRHEFNYWYPLDLRVSGKDLVTNHLVFCLYCHSTMWPESKCPRAIRANGHVFLNGEKMSKSTGNFLTLYEAIQEYSVDGTRFGMADAGDGLDDANFATKTADAAVLRLHSQIKWAEEILVAKDLRTGSSFTFFDQVFESEINKAIKETEMHYERTNFREALQTGFYALQAARDNYRLSCGSDNMHKDLLLKFIEVQALIMTPIIPHFSEYIWKLLGKKGSIRVSLWPTAGPINQSILKQNQYLFDITHEFRLRRETYMKPKKSKKGEEPAPGAPSKATIMVAHGYPEWKQQALMAVKSLFENNNAPNEKDIIAKLSSDESMKKNIKKIMPFIAIVKEQFKQQGISAFDLKLEFDEKEFVASNAEFIKKSLELKEVEVKYVEAEDQKERCSPGQPFVTFYP